VELLVSCYQSFSHRNDGHVISCISSLVRTGHVFLLCIAYEMWLSRPRPIRVRTEAGPRGMVSWAVQPVKLGWASKEQKREKKPGQLVLSRVEETRPGSAGFFSAASTFRCPLQALLLFRPGRGFSSSGRQCRRARRCCWPSSCWARRRRGRGTPTPTSTGRSLTSPRSRSASSRRSVKSSPLSHFPSPCSCNSANYSSSDGNGR
jgi:hypothetical protein